MDFMVQRRAMFSKAMLKNNLNSRLVYAFLIAVGLVLAGSGSGEARSLHEHHGHKAVLSFDDHKVDGHSCPLLHHSGKEVCPLTHHARIGNVLVIKNCGNNPEIPSSTSFSSSKETVAGDIPRDSSLPLEARQLPVSTVFYRSLLPDPLDHPPKSL